MAMAKVTETPFVLPAPLAELRRNGVELFCKNSFPEHVYYWPSWIKHESTRAKIEAVVDASEKLDATPPLGGYSHREIIRLRKGGDTLEADWQTSRTSVYLRSHRAATFDVYATISVKWNEQEVLQVRMGGDESSAGARWQIVAVKKYEPGAWVDLVVRINEASNWNRP
jgi:hypothetical protein